jgi:hypothetical protein
VSRDDREVRDRVLTVAYVEVGAANTGSCDADRNLVGGRLVDIELFDRQRCSTTGDYGSACSHIYVFCPTRTARDAASLGWPEQLDRWSDHRAASSTRLRRGLVHENRAL